jgi:hypothetical protein
MPLCYCAGGRRHFDPISTGSDWSPTADHYPRLKMHGGHLTPDNVRLAHRLCNGLLQRHPLTKHRRLNAEKIPPIHGTNLWTAASVRKAVVS